MSSLHYGSEAVRRGRACNRGPGREDNGMCQLSRVATSKRAFSNRSEKPIRSYRLVSVSRRGKTAAEERCGRRS